jgi:phosphoribosylformimino-5-aminoimidazole carboxamide ribotide isomerase
VTHFRPCIDLHQGQVKQIVGSSLKDDDTALKTNFVSQRDSSWYGELYQRDRLKGGHVIMLGPGNKDAAIRALKAYPGGLQIGGGINLDNAKEFLHAGASHIIVTSWIFQNSMLDWKRVEKLSNVVGKNHLVLDLSCRRVEKGWNIATDRWQTLTKTAINQETLKRPGEYCEEFLIHAADVEGKQGGMDLELIEYLGKNSPIPCTYAGGANSLMDLKTVEQLSNGRVDLTIGSALDIFGGETVKYQDCVDWNKKHD